MTTREWSEWRNGIILWIQSVYISPDYRRKGVYAGLYEHIKDLVRSSNKFQGIRLYVDKTNVKAQKVYQALGMNNQHYDLYEWIDE
jgi:ribosomal protein S18 acetylase RimI-like enzyme